MPVFKRYLIDQKLREAGVLIDDTDVNSKFFNVFDLESELPQGRTTFQVLGSDFIKPNIEYKIEFISSVGLTCYVEPVFYGKDDPSKHVMLEVYNDTAAGVATLYIMGELNPETLPEEIPEEWKDVYNVRWEKRIFIKRGQLMTCSRLTRSLSPACFSGACRVYKIKVAPTGSKRRLSGGLALA